MLGLHVTGAQDKVISARLNSIHSTIYTGRVCNFLGSVSTQQKFEVMDGPVLQSSFVCQAKENTSFRCEGRPTQKNLKRREARGPILASLFICFFLLPLSLPCVSWASQEGCFFHLRFSIWFLDLPLFYFCRLFPFFVF